MTNKSNPCHHGVCYYTHKSHYFRLNHQLAGSKHTQNQKQELQRRRKNSKIYKKRMFCYFWYTILLSSPTPCGYNLNYHRGLVTSYIHEPKKKKNHITNTSYIYLHLFFCILHMLTINVTQKSEWTETTMIKSYPINIFFSLHFLNTSVCVFVLNKFETELNYFKLLFVSKREFYLG